jgi:cardiolipin synthase
LLRQIPNLVSCARFLLAPLVVWAILAGDDRLALVLAMAGALTDALDGALARGFGWVSRTGVLLDPLADKFFIGSIFLTLWLARGESVAALVLARDAAILGGALWVKRKRTVSEFPPTLLGKASTAVQLAWLAGYLSRVPHFAILNTAMIALTLLSGADYIRAGIRMLQENRETPRDRN